MTKLQIAVEALKPKPKTLASRYGKPLSNDLKTKIRDSKSVANIKTNHSLTLNNKERRQSSSKKFGTTKSEKNINPIERKNFHKKPLKEEITLPSEGKETKSKDDGLGKTMPNRNNKFSNFQKKKDPKDAKETKEKKESDKNVSSKTPKNGDKKEFNLTMKDKRSNKKAVKSHDDAGKTEAEAKEGKEIEGGSEKEKTKKVAPRTPLYKKPADKSEKSEKPDKVDKKEKEVKTDKKEKKEPITNGKHDHKAPVTQPKVTKTKNEEIKTPVKNNPKAVNNHLDKTKEKESKTKKVEEQKDTNEPKEVKSVEVKIETSVEQKSEEPIKPEEITQITEPVKEEVVQNNVEPIVSNAEAETTNQVQENQENKTEVLNES